MIPHKYTGLVTTLLYLFTDGYRQVFTGIIILLFAASIAIVTLTLILYLFTDGYRQISTEIIILLFADSIAIVTNHMFKLLSKMGPQTIKW